MGSSLDKSFKAVGDEVFKVLLYNHAVSVPQGWRFGWALESVLQKKYKRYDLETQGEFCCLDFEVEGGLPEEFEKAARWAGWKIPDWRPMLREDFKNYSRIVVSRTGIVVHFREGK